MIIPTLVLIGKRLKAIPILGKLVDERFLHHRRRAQRIAGLLGFLVADALYGYRYFVDHTLKLGSVGCRPDSIRRLPGFDYLVLVHRIRGNI